MNHGNILFDPNETRYNSAGPVRARFLNLLFGTFQWHFKNKTFLFIFAAFSRKFENKKFSLPMYWSKRIENWDSTSQLNAIQEDYKILSLESFLRQTTTNFQCYTYFQQLVQKMLSELFRTIHAWQKSEHTRFL